MSSFIKENDFDLNVVLVSFIAIAESLDEDDFKKEFIEYINNTQILIENELNKDEDVLEEINRLTKGLKCIGFSSKQVTDCIKYTYSKSDEEEMAEELGMTDREYLAFLESIKLIAKVCKDRNELVEALESIRKPLY